ncbi:MAG: hypothetical protein M3336_06810 [Chloroflexota bacterium]|nr:hypothetical protein [Chloroflexota bacterium]
MAIGACVGLAAAGCGGDEKKTPDQATSTPTSPKQSTSPAPSEKQTRAAGIPSSNDDRKKYFMRIYCIGDTATQCKCKLESMGGNDEDTFADVLYRLKTNDQATVIRYGRASTGCA